jgi:hypothetical protein
MKDDHELTFLAVVLAVAFALALSLWAGFAVSILWGWFVVPLFGLRPLSIAAATGLCLIGGLLTAKYARPKEDDGWRMFVRALLHPPLAVLFGFVLRGFL